MTNPEWLAISLAIAFEIGAAASLASIITLHKMNKGIVWILFFLLTAMQAMGNAFHSYTHITNYQPWIELFGLVDEESITQKRILSIISGAILPLVALGFIKSLVDYLKPEVTNVLTTPLPEAVIQVEEPKTIHQEIFEANHPLEEIKALNDAEIEAGIEMTDEFLKEREVKSAPETIGDLPGLESIKKEIEELKLKEVKEESDSVLDNIKVFKANGN